MTNVTKRIFTDTMGGRSSVSYIGAAGEIFYDPTVGDLRISDGATAGGKGIFAEQNAGVYRGFQAGVNFFRNTNDQDIAQVIIHNAEGKVDYINYTTDTEHDDFYVTNLLQNDQDNGDNGANKVIMLNLYGATITDQTPILSISDVRTFVRKFIDTILFDEEDNERNSLEEVKTAFYENITALSQSLPDGTLFDKFAFDDFKRLHYPEYNAPEGGVDSYAQLQFWINGLDDTDSDLYSDVTQYIIGSAGSGYRIDDVIVMSGDQMGGTIEVNDLTLTVTQLKNGGVTQLEMTSGGDAFFPHVNIGDYEQLSGGTGGGCGIRINSCTEAGAIVSWDLRNGGGFGYEVGDTLTLNYGGADATFEVVAVGTDGIDGFDVSGTVHRGSPERATNGYWPSMHISDGRDDQYDGGNWISTDASTAIVSAEFAGRKMTITNTIKSGSGLSAGMYCTIRTNDYSYQDFTLVSQSSDNSNVWFIDQQINIQGEVTVRIDGLSYGDGNVTGTGAFNNESSYVVLYDNSIFAMVAFYSNINSLYYNGNMGVDSRGYKEVSSLLGAHTVDYTIKSIPQTLTQNADYYLQSSDAGKHIYYNNGGQNTVWLTAASSENFPIGTAITIVSGEDGWTFIRRDDSNVRIWGAGLNAQSNYFYIPENSMATLLKVAKDKWMLSGASLGNDD